MRPIEILLLITFGFWIAILYGIFILLMPENIDLIWIPIGLMVVTFVYILKKERPYEP